MECKVSSFKSGHDKTTFTFEKLHSTGASEVRCVDLYDDEVEMLKEKFCEELKEELTEAENDAGRINSTLLATEGELDEAKEILTKILNRLPSIQAKSFDDMYLLNALKQAEEFLEELKK